MPCNANALAEAMAKGLSAAPLRGERAAVLSAGALARLRNWVREAAEPEPSEAELITPAMARMRKHMLGKLAEATTTAERAALDFRLRDAYAAEHPRPDRWAVVFDALARCAPRW